MMQENFRREDEADLLRRLKAGEEKAWQEFTRSYGAKLHTYLRASLPDQESVEDVLSETMLSAVKAVQTYDEKESLTTMAFGLARNQIGKYWRKRNQTFGIDPKLSATSPSTETLVQGRLEFDAALTSLPENEQKILLLRYQMGLSTNKIAETMELSYKTVENLLASARNHLREALDEAEIASAPDSSKLQLLIHSLSQMLHRQVQRCLAFGMKEEAALFARYAAILMELVNEFSIQPPLERDNKTVPNQQLPAV